MPPHDLRQVDALLVKLVVHDIPTTNKAAVKDQPRPNISNLAFTELIAVPTCVHAYFNTFLCEKEHPHQGEEEVHQKQALSFCNSTVDAGDTAIISAGHCRHCSITRVFQTLTSMIKRVYQLQP